jgi:hypothetical protein
LDDPYAYLRAVMNDKSVSSARRDGAARTMMTALARQGGLGKKMRQELDARLIGTERGGAWWDEELGINLLDVGVRPEAAQRREERARTTKSGQQPYKEPERPSGLPKTDWGDDLSTEDEPYRPQRPIGGVKYQGEPPDDE